MKSKLGREVGGEGVETVDMMEEDGSWCDETRRRAARASITS